jgi:ribose-phosphate pyrophosphokinase
VNPVVLALPGNESLAEGLAARLGAEVGRVRLHRFPDGETYVRVETPLHGRDVTLVCTLPRPDEKLIPLLFLAATVRDLGATRVGLVAPYLAYMRQDRRFREGEGITSAYFARVLSAAVDWVVTVDPHLHRRTSLDEIYSIPSAVVHAATHISAWVRQTVRRPVFVGPDEESAQWVRDVADGAAAPFIVFQKVRRGDRDVSVTVPDVEHWREHTPVLVDDIISTARTMIVTVRQLIAAGLSAPVCVGVHAVFASGAYDELRASGSSVIATCNTIPHASNAIDLTGALTDSVRQLGAQLKSQHHARGVQSAPAEPQA